ncbi:zinc finger protein 62 homolog isoform X2 [Cryptotermes secundus]|nr:zinc finger protein 62 homolog isoform X2 [Cryptotermes secundus]
MGEGFMVVVSIEDMLCKHCGALLNHLDKLESDLDIVKRALTGYLKMKYGLTEDTDEQRKHLKQHITNQTNVQEIASMRADDTNSDIEDTVSEDSHESESVTGSSHGAVNNKRTIEILLDEGGASKDHSQIQKQDSSQSLKMYKCTVCNFKTSELTLFLPHLLSCIELPYKCTMCEKRFESHKYVRNHIMEAHLSNWTCHFCNKKFSEEEDFTAHMKIHLGHRNGSPKIHTEDSQSAIGSVNALYSSQSVLGNYECNICDYQCSSKEMFDKHVRRHSMFKIFHCNVCRKEFQHQEDLSHHVSELCSAESKNKSSLLDYQHTLTTEMKGETFHDRGDEITELSYQKSDGIVKPPSEERQLDSFITETKNKPHGGPSDECRGNEIEFHTCRICSLTFVNESLFMEHIKMHKQEGASEELFRQNSSQLLQMGKVSPDDDSTEHEVNSIDSEGRQQYVELDESLEDMFEKLHAETETIHSSEMKEASNRNTLSVSECNICHEEFVNYDDLQLHKVTQMHLGNDSQNDVDMLIDNKSGASVPDPFDQCKTEENILDMQQNERIVDSGLNAETSSVGHIGNPEILPVQHDHCQIQENENAKDGFLDIFDMVREKKLSAKDSAKIDTNLLQETQVKTEQIEVVPAAEFHPYISDMKHLGDSKLYDTAPIPIQSKKTYVCAMCGYRTSAMFDLRRHFKEHRQKTFHCKICNKVLPSTQKLCTHLKSHEKFHGRMTCPYCYGQFPDRCSLQQHLQEKHQKEKVMYKCSFCSDTFNTKKAYKVHEEIHPERFSFRCNECGIPFLKEKQLLDHKDSIHRDPHCRFCGKEIVKAKTLRNHELRHLRQKDSFECDICKRVFKTKTGLRHHIAVHTGEYKYCCDYCGRGFMSRMMMEEHRSKHTKEERYICDVCGRKFSFQSTYWIHRKWHDNPYPYKCSFCGRMFRHSSLLAVHKRTHTGERPYKCPHCPLTFPVGGTLKRHLILHTGVYPFNCENCKRGFTTRHKYATHLAKIHGDFEMLHTKPQQSEFKMVIRDDPRPVQQPTVWEVTDNSVPDQMNFKLETVTGDDTSKDPAGEGIACTIVSDDLLVDNMVPTRVVEIVLDETSQAVATVTLAEHANILPDIWYQ